MFIGEILICPVDSNVRYSTFHSMSVSIAQTLGQSELFQVYILKDRCTQGLDAGLLDECTILQLPTPFSQPRGLIQSVIWASESALENFR